MSEIVFRHQDDAGSFLVEPVDNSRAQRIPAFGERLAAAKQCVHQSSARVSRAGMYGHTGGFVHDDHIGIFVENVERNGFRFGAHWRTSLRIHHDFLAGTQSMRAFGGLAVDQHQACFD